MAAGGAHVRAQSEFGALPSSPPASSSKVSNMSGLAPPSLAARGRTLSEDFPRPILRHNAVRVSSPLRSQYGVDTGTIRNPRPVLRPSHSANASLGGSPTEPTQRLCRGRSDNHVAWAQTVCDPMGPREELAALDTGGLSTGPRAQRRSRGDRPRSATERPASVTGSSRLSRTVSQYVAPPPPKPKTGLWGDIEPPPGFGPTHPSTAKPGLPVVEFSDLRAPTFSRETLRKGGVIMPTPSRRPASVAVSQRPGSVVISPRPTSVSAPNSPRKAKPSKLTPEPTEPELKHKTSATLLSFARKISTRRSQSQPAAKDVMPPPPVPPMPSLLPSSPASTLVPRPPQPPGHAYGRHSPRSPIPLSPMGSPTASTQPQAAAYPTSRRVSPGHSPPQVALPPTSGQLPPGAGSMLPPGAMLHPEAARAGRMPIPRSTGAPISGTPMPAPPPDVLRSWAPPSQQPLRHYSSTPALGAAAHHAPPLPLLQPSPMVSSPQQQYRPPQEFAPVPCEMWAQPPQQHVTAPDAGENAVPEKPEVPPQLPALDFSPRKSTDFMSELEGLEGSLGMLCLPDLPSDGGLLPDLPNLGADDATERAISDKTISPPGSPKRWPPRASPIERAASVRHPQLLDVPSSRMHPSSAPSTPLLPNVELEASRPVESLSSMDTKANPSSSSVNDTRLRPPGRMQLPSGSLDSCQSLTPPPRGMSLYASLEDDLRPAGASTPTPHSPCTTPQRARAMGRSCSSMSQESSQSLSSESTLSSLTSASSAASVDMPDPIAEDVSEDVHVGRVYHLMPGKMEFDRPRRVEAPRRQVE